MGNKDQHPTGQDLLRLADGELPAREAAQLRRHLAACWDCRSRLAEIEATIGEFMRTHHAALDSLLPPADGPRAQLKVHLEQLALAPECKPRAWLPFGLNVRALSALAAAVVVAVLGAIALHRLATKSQPEPLAHSHPLPDPNLTPGMTAPVAVTELCSSEHDAVVRYVPSSLQQTIFQEYGMPGAPADNYEIDFLISPGLGGAEDIRNLWPEPRSNTLWNSLVKDQLEDYLHRSVCDGKLSLSAAQQDIAADWISAYKKYFHTDKPTGNLPLSNINPGWYFSLLNGVGLRHAARAWLFKTMAPGSQAGELGSSACSSYDLTLLVQSLVVRSPTHERVVAGGRSPIVTRSVL